jgi:hypothetical protein
MHPTLDDVAALVRVLRLPIQAPEVWDLRRAFSLQEDYHSELTYLESEKNGIALASKEGMICSVFLFAAGKDGYQQYKGILPFRITFDYDRERIRSVLGQPAASSPAEELTKSWAHGGWDKYILAGCSVHFTYSSKTGAIELVTLEPHD